MSMIRMASICAALALWGCAGDGSQDPPTADTGGFGGTFGGTTGTHGGTFGSHGSTGGFGTGEASLHSEDGYGFPPTAAQLSDPSGAEPVQRAVVDITDDIYSVCGQNIAKHVVLTFGTPGTVLTAGSYLVDGGATIVWDPGTRPSTTLSAVQGLINCNSISGGKVAGSFTADLPLEDGGISKLTGIFTAENGCVR